MSNPIAGGTIVADGIYQFMQSMLYAPGKFVVKRDSINFFDCEHLAIHRTWLLAGEQRVLDWLFVHREDIFEKVAMKPNDRFILEGIKGLSADALLPTQLRRKVVRDASYYLCMRMPSMQQHLLQSAQRLMIKSDQGRKDEFVFHLQHALQQTPKCIERMVTVYPPDI